jgi:spermidine synthase
MDTLTNRTVVVDDAKHFIANSTDKYDLIVTDTPAALTLQTATLYSSQFYHTIAEHLTPQGVLVANMTSSFTPTDRLSRRVAASLLANFRYVLVVSPLSVGWSFAYASNDIPFDRKAIETALRSTGEIQFTIFDTPAVRAIVGDAEPITLDSMDFVLQTSIEWVGDRLSW